MATSLLQRQTQNVFQHFSDTLEVQDASAQNKGSRRVPLSRHGPVAVAMGLSLAQTHTTKTEQPRSSQHFALPPVLQRTLSLTHAVQQSFAGGRV